MSTTIKHLRSVIAPHYVAILFGLLLGVIAIGPYFYFAQTAQYKGIALTGQDAEEHYVARTQEAAEGRPWDRNVYLPYKNVPYLETSFGEDIVAGLGTIMFLSATQINVVSKFVFPFLVFLVVYALGFVMTRSRLAGLLAATLAMLGNDVMSYPLDLLQLLHGTSLNDGMYWARPINPEVSGLFLFGSLLLIYRAYCMRTNFILWQPIAIGLLAGLSLYVSPYPWLFLGALLVILLVWALWQKEHVQAKNILGAGIIVLLCAIPFALNYLQYKNYPGYANAAFQTGALHSHTPVLGIWVFVLLLMPLFIWPKEWRAARVFFIASAIALLLVLNQQVLSGIYLQPGHFHWYITKPLVGIMLGVYLVWLLQKFVPSRALRITAASTVMLILFAHAALAQVHFYQLHAPAAVVAQSYAPALTYLNTLPHQIVFANPTLSDYIAMYTHDDAPGDASAGLYIAPKDYFEKQLFLQYRLRNILPQNVLTQMQKEQPAILQSLYGIYYTQVLTQLGTTSDAVLASLAQKYAASYQQPIPTLMQELGITLLLQDTASDNWDLRSASGILPMHTINGRFIVYSATTSSLGSTSVKK